MATGFNNYCDDPNCDCGSTISNSDWMTDKFTNVKYKISFIPRYSSYSGDLIWFQRAYRIKNTRPLLNGRTRADRWFTSKEYLILSLRS